MASQRQQISCALAIYAKHKSAEITGGFKCFRREALEKIDLDRVTSEGYFFQVEMNYRARQEGLQIRQIPICFTERRCGIFKMGIHEAQSGMCQLLRAHRN